MSTEQKIITAVHTLVEFCRSGKILESESVWRLSTGISRELNDEMGFNPPGGWRGLVSLLVGTGVFKAEEGEFALGERPPEAITQEPGDVQVALMESYFRYMIPPSSAAGLFLAMGIHPLWGLRLARSLHRERDFLSSPGEWQDEELLPDENLASLREGVFASLSVFLSKFRQLGDRTEVSNIQEMVQESLEFGRDRIVDNGEGLEMMVDSPGKKSKKPAYNFASNELLNKVFVPAGAVNVREEIVEINDVHFGRVMVDNFTAIGQDELRKSMEKEVV